MYQAGNGVTKNTATAASFYKKGCDLGAATVCNGLASAYFVGNGLPQDRALAETYFKKACDGLEAQVNAATQPSPNLMAQRDTACRNQTGTACVNRVQVPARRRADLDSTCRRHAIGTTAWSTLNGTDNDDCMNAMMNRGCTEAMGLHVYCCPAN